MMPFLWKILEVDSLREDSRTAIILKKNLEAHSRNFLTSNILIKGGNSTNA